MDNWEETYVVLLHIMGGGLSLTPGQFVVKSELGVLADWLETEGAIRVAPNGHLTGGDLGPTPYLA